MDINQEFQLFVEPILDPTKELSEQTKFGVFIKPLSGTKAFLCYGSEDECQSYIRKVNEMYPDICKNTKKQQLNFGEALQKIEEWAKENTESVENQSGDRGGVIWTSELLTYLQTLKK